MSERRSALARFCGYAMMGVGALITLLSGGCTLLALYVNTTSNGVVMAIESALVFSLPFLAIGIGLYVGGRSLVRRNTPRDPPGNVF